MQKVNLVLCKHNHPKPNIKNDENFERRLTMDKTIEIRNQKREELYKLVDGLDIHEIETLFQQVLESVKFDAIYKKK